MTKSEIIKEQLKVCIKGKCPQDCEYIQVDNCWMALVGELLKEQEAQGWVSVKDRLPENEKDVLLIKQLKSGQRNIGIGYCIADYEFKNYATGETWRAPYWVCSGNNNVVYWMPLPEMPKEADEEGENPC